MDDKIYLIYELPPFTVCKTANSKKPVTYIFLSADTETYTVYTNEQKGFIMTANKDSSSKQIKVTTIYPSPGNFKTLADFTYPDSTHEELRNKAIEYLTDNERKLKPQGKKILDDIKNADTQTGESNKDADEQEQQEIIKELEKSNISKTAIIEKLRNLKETDAEIIIINSKSFKRDNQTIALIKYVRDFKCQLCGYYLLKKNGSYYIEAAHIEPKHRKGAETLDNIILLCPNHHKEFDLGDSQIIKHTKTSLELLLNGKNYTIQLIPDLK